MSPWLRWKSRLSINCEVCSSVPGIAIGWVVYGQDAEPYAARSVAVAYIAAVCELVNEKPVQYSYMHCLAKLHVFYSLLDHSFIKLTSYCIYDNLKLLTET